MANYYLTITPVDTLSTSTYSIYFDEIKSSNLLFSGVPQSTLAAGFLVYFTGSAANATSVYVKNEDPDCCCSSQKFIFPTPSPTTAPTTAAPTTAAPTTAAPTTAAPTTAAPTTAAPTTAAPTTTAPTTPAPTNNYTITLTNPGSGINSTYQLGGSFHTGDTVVISANFNGGGTTATVYNGRADLSLFNSSAGVTDSAQSSCFPVGNPMSWNLNTQITFSYNTANSVLGTTAVVNNGSANTSGVTVSIVSVNGVLVGVNTNGNKNNSGGSVC